MKKNFTFDTETYNYWPIYEAIKKYYPLGIFQNDEDSASYQSYPGLRELEKILLENIHNEESYRKDWITFLDFLKDEFKKEVIGTTYGNSPCFSAYIKLKEKLFDNITVYKELHFAISLLCPFYSIYGLDYTTLTLEKETYKGQEAYSNLDDEDKLQYFEAINSMTVSPYSEYKEYFIKLERKIKERFTNYRLVPHSINCMYLSGLTLFKSFSYSKKSCTIHSGLFHDHFEVNTKVHLIRGDEEYGSKQWEI
ncbi:hypothetical protein GXP67_23640 [Rhodocytophaga rosea]|uniref:Uncharacterized protein n=1 Tax=Rhodocytophaga rosea TaxID=2704465 RepID=A0A6C0GP75_9BACT|nr:hypothetical protein [Rhodocytophaga rosea]QHT69420.1 hypothetical protein GXP67_23640 [Rhodocytophaga rosea]